MLVLDCSATLAWLMPDESDERIHAVFKQVADGGAAVPQLWHLEVANALLVAERRGRIDRAFRVASLADLRILPIAIDGETMTHAWSGIAALAERHGLTVYDAAYLELAQRLGLPLATLDGELSAAAVTAGVKVV